jgi:hypothetical protein
MIEVKGLQKCDALRELDNVSLPDERYVGFVMINRVTGEERAISLSDFHSDIGAYELLDAVPNNVRVNFETAKNAYLYSWFVYRFGMLAKLHAIAALELALREKAKCVGITHVGQQNKKLDKATLSKLLDLSVEKEWVEAEVFSHIIAGEGAECFKNLKGLLLLIRNELAHGSDMLLPPYHALDIFEVTSIYINRLFTKG